MPSLRAALGSAWLTARGHKGPAYLRQYMRTPALSRAETEERTFAILVDRVRHAQEHVPFYRRRYQQAGVSWQDLKAPDDLPLFPMVTREDLIDGWRDMIDERMPLESLHRYGSGGSTGVPVITYNTQEERYRTWAVEQLSFHIHGIPRGSRIVRLWGAPQDMIKFRSFRGMAKRLFQNDSMLDAFHMDPPIMAGYVERINVLKPYAMLAYPEAADLLARYIEDNGLSVHSPAAIVTSAGPLLPAYRANIERVFRAPVMDRYGCREGGVISYQCPAKQGLHIFPFRTWIETVREGQPVGPGVDGHILITPLMREAMPLIRYDVGDVGRLLEKGCSCALPWPCMEISVGRSSDVFVTSGGGLVAGSGLTTFMANHEGLKLYQIEQATDRSVTVRLVTDARFAEASRERIRTKLGNIFGPDIPLTVVDVDDIVRTSSGKIRPIISQARVQLTRENAPDQIARGDE